MSYRDLYLASDPLITNLKSGQKPLAKVLGIPFDSTSTYRPGSRFGPNALRQAFLNIEIYSPRLDVDLEEEGIEDLGNLRVSGDVDKTIGAVSRVVKEVMEEGDLLTILGGEHTITLGSGRSLPQDAGIVVFDAHLDLRDEFMDLRISHATYLRRLLEERGGTPIVHVGARAGSREEWEFLKESMVTAIPYYEGKDFTEVERRFKESLGKFERLYVSIDLDVLDPAFAPGVGNPEPAGLSTRQLLDLLYSLSGKKVLGFDIVELCPPWDNGSTSVAAAKVLGEMLAIIRARERPD